MKEKNNKKKEKALRKIDKIQRKYFPNYGEDKTRDQFKSYTPAREYEKEEAQVPDISFIVPIYNRAIFLPKCLDSILNQTHKNFELICVNDGSTDNSLEILREYAKRDARISIVDKENGGGASARNCGLEYMHAPLISFIDSDDWIDEKFAEYAILEMNKDASLSYFCCGVQGVTNDEEFLSDIKHYEMLHRKNINGKQKVNEILARYVSHEVWNKVFRKSIIEENKIRFNSSPRGTDLLFFYKYCAHSQFAYYCNERLYFYLRHADSLVSISQKLSPHMLLVLFLLFKDIYLYYEKLGLLSEYKDALAQDYCNCTNTVFFYVRKHNKKISLKLHKAFLDILDERYFDIVAIEESVNTYPSKSFSRFMKRLFSVTREDNNKIAILCGLKIVLKKGNMSKV